MDLISVTVGLPFAPLRGVLALARVIQAEVDRQLYDPATVRRELEEIDAARSRGDLAAHEAAARERRTVGRLIES